MLVLKINLARDKRGEKFKELLGNIIDYVNCHNLDKIKVTADKDFVEVTAQSSGEYDAVENDNPISVELSVSKNILINNANKIEDADYQAIKYELDKFIKY